MRPHTDALPQRWMRSLIGGSALRAGLPVCAVWLLALLAVAAQAASPDPVAITMRRSLKALDIPEGSASLIVRELDSGQTLVSLNADTPRNPASVMKIVTSFAALDQLGAGYRWRTEAFVNKKPDGIGRVQDVYLRGQGNPLWVADDFLAFVRGIYTRGVRDIQGDLVLDRSYYDVPPGDPAAFDGKPLRVYNVLPDPFTMNFSSLSLLLVPNVAAHRLDIQVDPPVTTLSVDNRVVLKRAACKRQNMRLRMGVDEDDNGFVSAQVRGEFPNGCREFELVRVLLDADDQLVGAFEARWDELGGSWSGGSREDEVPKDAVALYEQVSPPLAEILRGVNKFSNNVMARQVFLTLGAEVNEAPATLAKSRAAVASTLESLSIPVAGLFVENGSGLSRDARVSALTLIELLHAAWRHRAGPDFYSSLPVPGVDGTLKTRFEKGRFVGQAHVKTGTLDHVVALAGVVHAYDGRRYLVAFMLNHNNVHQGKGRSLQKKLLRVLVERDTP